jgi:hypothetical protein
MTPEQALEYLQNLREQNRNRQKRYYETNKESVKQAQKERYKKRKEQAKPLAEQSPA